MKAQHRDDSPEMNLDQLKTLVFQGMEIGVSFMVPCRRRTPDPEG